MKKEWAKMDDSLSKQEIFSGEQVKEMLYDRSRRSMRKLIKLEVWGVVVVVALIAVIFAILPTISDFAEWLYCMIIVFICVIGLIWQLFKLRELRAMDVAADVKDNLKRINRYKLHIRGEKIAGWIACAVIILTKVLLSPPSPHVPLAWWIVFGVFTLLIIWLAIRWARFIYGRYDANITSIRRSLDELKELEEE